MQNIRNKCSDINTAVEDKYPRVHKAAAYMKCVWDETFPNEDRKVKTKLQQRKEIARLQKESDLSQEELDRIEGSIPDWKKGAVTVTDGQV